MATPSNQKANTKEKWKGLSTRKKLEFIGGLVVVLFTVIMVIINYMQRNDFNAASKRELRAFVQMVEPVFIQDTLYQAPDGYPLVRVECKLKNVGATTAYSVRWRCIPTIVDSPYDAKIPDPKTWDLSGAPCVVGAGVAVPLAAELEGPRKSLRGVNLAEQRIFFFGIVRYKDIYGDDHWTTFCYHLVFRHESSFFQYHLFNDADREF